jgi:regulator of sirC expression with transglutaminase-like and TPR domain
MHLADVQARLKKIGTLPEKDVPIAETLLLLGALDLEGAEIASYQAHLQEMHEALLDYIKQNPKTADESELDYRLKCLNTIIIDEFGYRPEIDYDSYDDPDKINFLQVIDKRSGIPIALGTLYMQLARNQGWDISGLNFPGHFLFRLEDGVQHAIIDPFQPQQPIGAGQLRNLLKKILGERAELHHEYYNPVTIRHVVLRFCNKRKTRLITQGDYTRALKMVTHELWVAPEEPRLYFDAGVISIKVDRLIQAIEYLQEFVQMSNDAKTVSEAYNMIRALQRKLY